MRYSEGSGFYEMDPEFWTLYDLRRPSDECILPLPIRWPNSGKIVKTCPHCGREFVLISALTEDAPDGREAVFWADKFDDDRMQAAWDRREREQYRGHYGQGLEHYEDYGMVSGFDFPQNWRIDDNDLS